MVHIRLTADERRALSQVLNEALKGIGLAHLNLGTPVDVIAAKRLAGVLSLEVGSAVEAIDITLRSVRVLRSLCQAVGESLGDDELHTRVGLHPAEFRIGKDRIAQLVEATISESRPCA